MKIRKYLVAVAAVAALTAGALPVALASAGTSTSGPVGTVRDATRDFRNVDAAIGAGYVQFFGCVHEPLAGSMGIHFVNGALVGDGKIDPEHPEAVVYEPQADNKLGLVAAEYIVFKAAWDAKHKNPPKLFGQTFMETGSPNRFGIDAFYALHVWAWKSNPTGTFQMWNPRVLCLNTEGHV